MKVNAGIGKYLDLGAFDDSDEDDHGHNGNGKSSEKTGMSSSSGMSRGNEGKEKKLSEGELKRQKILEELEKQIVAHETSGAPPDKKKKVMMKGGFGDFSSWYLCLFESLYVQKVTIMKKLEDGKILDFPVDKYNTYDTS